MSADEIYLKAKMIVPKIAVGTVYRNLDIMVKSKEIRRIEVPNAADRYDKSLHPHDHIICDSCGAVLDIHINGLKKLLEEETGLTVFDYNLLIKHICDDCRTK